MLRSCAGRDRPVKFDLPRRAIAEAVGTAMLLTAVVGSGIMGASRRIHWSIADPAVVEGDDQTRLEAFRHARDELRERLRKFIEGEVVDSQLV